MCPDCAAATPFYWRSKAVKSRHNSDPSQHPGLDLEQRKRQPKNTHPVPQLVKVQTVFALDSYRRDFRVEPALASGPSNQAGAGVLADAPEGRAFHGFLAFRETVPRMKIMPQQQGLQGTWPYIHFLSWDKLVERFDLQDLIDQADLPSRVSHIFDLVQLCEQVFTEEQQFMDMSAHPMILQQINDPQDG
ncbi:hypothetical protein RhiLY_12077 [Ceratobasidium sp. AG-Ba]|nr:hypothetical protein RhiLY_12077 [Ceratobasidium sp. AG-Ba]